MPGRPAVRAAAVERAAYRCEYCQVREWWLEVDHIIPLARWGDLGGGPGLDDLPNPAAARVPCNSAKRDHVAGVDELTGTAQVLFNPRTQTWSEHSRWTDDDEWILGISPVGRATVVRLKMNRPMYRWQRKLLRAAAKAGAAPWP